jgi:hypothetical protein
LRVIHAATVSVFLNKALNAPLEVCGRLLRSTAKIDVVFDLESPDAVVKAIQFIVNGGHETVLAENAELLASYFVGRKVELFVTIAHVHLLILSISPKAVTGILPRI